MEKKLLTFCGGNCKLKKCKVVNFPIKGFGFSAPDLIRRGIIKHDPSYCMSLTERNYVLSKYKVKIKDEDKKPKPLTLAQIYGHVSEYREKNYREDL